MPVVLDASTAIYSLHLSGVGSRLTIRDAADRPVTLEVVGLLKNSVLQGNLLVSEANFLRMFPDTGGYRYFLDRAEYELRRRPERMTRHESRAATLESTLAADGFDAVDAREQLAGFLAVQNTYLSTFQSLGALGLLLGHGRPGGGAVAERAGAARRTGADAGRRLSTAAGWCGWSSGKMACCSLGGLVGRVSRPRRSRSCRNGRRRGRACRG